MNFEKKLNALTTILMSIESDSYPTEDGWEFGPAYVNGKFNPDLAYAIMRRTQGKLFYIMKKNGLTLHGWAQFESFVSEYWRSRNILTAYRTALEE